MYMMRIELRPTQMQSMNKKRNEQAGNSSFLVYNLFFCFVCGFARCSAHNTKFKLLLILYEASFFFFVLFFKV